MTMIKSHDSSMKSHDKKLHALLNMEAFIKSVIIYELKQKET